MIMSKDSTIYMPNGNLFGFFLFKVMIIDSKIDGYNLINLPIRKT